MARRHIAALALAAVSATVVPASVSAVSLDTPTLTCLTTKYGAKVAAQIRAAKKLSAAQNKQLAVCKAQAAPPAGGASASGSLTALTYSLLWSVGSQQGGLGNVSDPALLQLADGSIRLFFKNGNEPQIPISGFDNKIHSYVSRDNGVTWTLESGVRIDVGSPVSVRVAESGGYEAYGWVPSGTAGVDALTRFTSSDGYGFTRGSGSAVVTAACKNSDGGSAGFLGDAQVVKVASGYLAFAQDLASGKSAPFKRQACKLVSTDGTTWSVDATGTFAFAYDIQTNPELYRNATGQLELLLPVDNAGSKYLEVRTSTNDGASWSSVSKIPLYAADPERLDLSNGDSLLAFGNFDHTKGGLLAVARKASGSYSANRVDSTSSVSWTVKGASSAEVKVMNLCTSQDLTSAAKVSGSSTSLAVSWSSTGGPGSTNCVYLLIGTSRFII